MSMKNTYTSLIALLVVLGLFSFKKINTASDMHQKVVQQALDAEIFEDILTKSQREDKLPLVFITNRLISEALTVTLHDQELILVSSMEDVRLQPNEFSFIELTALSVKNHKAKLSFRLDGYKIKVTLKNDQDEWRYASSQARKKGHLIFDTEF